MTNAKTSNGGEDITATSDPISTALAEVAVAFSTLASRASEASRSVRGASSRERALVLRDICRAIRDGGDGCHDYARSLEEFLRS